MKTLGEIAGSAQVNGDETTVITGISCDSRTVKPGFLFAALPGTKTDGAKYVTSALQNGAQALLLDEHIDRRPALFVPYIYSSNPRKDLALMAARFYGRQPGNAVAVTGTNGKTSVASFVQQIWQAMGIRGASLGTVGIQAGDQHWPLSHTTPDPVVLHENLAMLADEGVTHLAIEASSHGLEQRRLEGVHLAAAAFTNITQDHLDYHGSMEEYFAQKLRLFSELLPKGASVVVDADIEGSQAVIDIAAQRDFEVISVGRKGQTLLLEDLHLSGYGQTLHVRHEGELFEITTDLIGTFQASNLLVAAGLCLAAGADWQDFWDHIGSLNGAKGRMEIVGKSSEGVPVIVDYAHTPDALENAILALKPISKGGKIHLVFGCGGDRDKGKRPLMGAIAQKHSDITYVTDDNPRSEDPAMIRAEILAAAPDAIEIGDRQQAINEAVRHLASGDILLVAGKGHEEGQKVGDKLLPFLDHDAVAKALALLDGESGS